MEKPTALTIEELKKSIVETINASKLPIFILDYIFKDLYNEIHLMNLSQTEQEKNAYKESLNKEEGNTH